MSAHKYTDQVCILIMALAVVLTVLFMNGERLGLEVLRDTDTEEYSDRERFTKNDRNADWNTDGACRITLSGDRASVKGRGAYVNGSTVTIHESGRYVVSGTLDEGQLTVSAHKNSKIWILLDNVSLHCSDDAAFRVDQADKVFLTLKEGSRNALSSGAAYTEAALADGTDGVIYSHDDLTINGSGALDISAQYKHGITVNDELVITGGVLTVTAPRDGMHANDSIRITGAETDIRIEAGDDGMAAAKGTADFYLEDGYVQIVSADDGIHAAGDIVMDGGHLVISAGDDAIHSDTLIRVTDGTLDIPRSHEGLEARRIEILGGELSVVADDDGLNADQGGSKKRRRAGESEEIDAWLEQEYGEPLIFIGGGTLAIDVSEGRKADAFDSNSSIRLSGGTVYVRMNNDKAKHVFDYDREHGSCVMDEGATLIVNGVKRESVKWQTP